MHEPQAFVPAAIAPLQVFGTSEDPFEPPQLSQSHELFCVEDLDLPGLNTTFKDTFLEEHLLVSSISNHDDWSPSTQVQPRTVVLRTLHRTGLFCP